MSAVPATTAHLEASGADFERFSQRQRDSFDAAAQAGPLFQTDADGKVLWELFLNALPPGERQHHTCHACRDFVERFGDIVVIDSNGHATPVMWDTAAHADDPVYGAAVRAVDRTVRKARVTGPFRSGDKIWGQPRTSDWTHMWAANPKVVGKKGRLTPSQQMAEKREDYRTLSRGLAEFDAKLCRNALHLLTTGQLERSEKAEGVARWLVDLHEARASRRGRPRDNVVWLAVATAPAGFCHIRSTMIGTLISDLAAGKSFDEVAAAWKSKMHPLRYQRPQAAPKAGAIREAEKLFEEMGLRSSLDRRFARIEEYAYPVDSGSPASYALRPLGGSPRGRSRMRGWRLQCQNPCPSLRHCGQLS